MPIIYAIYASPCHLPYYGSTSGTLAERKRSHNSGYKKSKAGTVGKCSAYILFDEVGFENCIFETVECLPDDFTKKQILECEKVWIENNICINKNRPIRTEEERKSWEHTYYETNRERCKQYVSNYQKANRAKINERRQKRRAEKKVKATL
jgi:hypothetical protein